MNGFLTEPVILSGNQSVKFLDSLRRPDREYLDRLHGIFRKMDEDISIRRMGMDMELEIAGLDLSFLDKIDEKMDLKRKMSQRFNWI